MHTIVKKLTRSVVNGAVFFLPYEKKRAIERWLRGREEARKLGLADWVLVSWGKSGRTWLRVMMSRVYQQRYSLPQRMLLGFDNMHRKNAEAPKVFFTHGNYLKDYTGNTDNKSDFYHRKVVLLIRDPRDVAVSQFFQWKYRMRSRKKRLNEYPEHGEDIAMYDFVMNPKQGLPRIIDFMNGWAAEIPNLNNLLLVRYEDMRAQPAKELARMMAFTGTPATAEEIDEAVDYAAFTNMRRLEQRKVFWLSGGRMVPKDRQNLHTYKVRRAKVGGYRDYFDDDQVREIDRLVERALMPVFGYRGEACDAEPGEAKAATVASMHSAK